MYCTVPHRNSRSYRTPYQTVKRVLDFVVCIVALPVIIPAVVACAIAIHFDSPGPVLFVQDRIGKGRRPFKMYKFRTMYCGSNDGTARAFMKAYVRGRAEPNGSTFKPNQLNQITRVGRLLRKTSLDELPQVINVLKGEMSIVGPRPNVIWEVEEYSPWHVERLETLPGITGLAQVMGRSSIDFATLVRHDIQYIENQSWRLDLKILWWTVAAVFKERGAE